MQSDTQFPMADLVENNVLVRRRKMRRLRRAGALLNQAESQAKTLIKQASQSAQAVEAAAWQEGYCQGLQLAVGTLASQMADYQQWSQRATQQLQQQLGQQLQQLFSNAAVLPDLLLAFSETLTGDAPRITLLLPEAWRKTVLTMKARLGEITPCALDYQYHPHSFCVLKAGDQLIDFDAEAITAVMSPALINHHHSRQFCYQLSADYLQQIKVTINQHIDDLLLSLNEPEERDNECEPI